MSKTEKPAEAQEYKPGVGPAEPQPEIAANDLLAQGKMAQKRALVAAVFGDQQAAPDETTGPHDLEAAIDVTRYNLVTARAGLRKAEDSYKLETALAEQRAIDAAVEANPGVKNPLGDTEAARARALTLALADDELWLDARETLRWYQKQVEMVTAGAESLVDVRRKEERESRDKLAAAMLGRPSMQADQITSTALALLERIATAQEAQVELYAPTSASLDANATPRPVEAPTARTNEWGQVV